MNRGVVLVVDDEFKIRSLLELYLIEHDYEVITASCGKEALSAVEKYRPDVVVLDILMPDMNGLEVCRKIRARGEIPIIFLSCLQESETVIQGLEFGGDDYLTKPFDPNVLIARINALLRRTKNNKVIEYQKVKSQYETLTAQEGKILHCIEKGYTNKEIANKLNLTVGTIKVYNHIIFQKLQVKNRTQAIVRAKEVNII